MKGFIELIDYDGEITILCPVSKITAVVCNHDGSVFVETGVDGKGISSGILTKETYEEVKEKIKTSEV